MSMENEVGQLDGVAWVNTRGSREDIVALGAAGFGSPSTAVVAEVVDIVGEHGEIVCSQGHEVVIRFDAGTITGEGDER